MFNKITINKNGQNNQNSKKKKTNGLYNSNFDITCELGILFVSWENKMEYLKNYG